MAFKNEKQIREDLPALAPSDRYIELTTYLRTQGHPRYAKLVTDLLRIRDLLEREESEEISAEVNSNSSEEVKKQETENQVKPTAAPEVKGETNEQKPKSKPRAGTKQAAPGQG